MDTYTDLTYQVIRDARQFFSAITTVQLFLVVFEVAAGDREGYFQGNLVS